MTSSAFDLKIPAAVAVRLSNDTLTVDTSDGRSVSVPLDWFPRLRHATSSERENWRLIGNGVGLHWPDLDEDVSVESLIRGEASAERPESLARWLAARP